MEKSADAFRTISEAAAELQLPQHVLRFWETRFPQIKPMKRAGGRRYYRPQDLELLHAIKHLLYAEGFTIKGVQRILKEQGARAVTSESQGARQEGLPDSQGEEGDAPAVAWEDQDEGLGEGEPAMPATDALGGSGPRIILSSDDVARLNQALAQLAECIEILEQARGS